MRLEIILFCIYLKIYNMKSQKGLYSHWEKIYQHQDSDFRSYSIKILIKNMLDKNIPVVDLGCGTGAQIMYLAKQGFDATGVDESEEMLNMARDQAKSLKINNVNFIQNTLKELTEEGETYSQIICLDVIEHIEKDDEALKQINKLLSPEGRLILTVPAHQYLYSKRDKDIGHYRRYSKSELINKMQKAGFIVRKHRYWNFLGYLITYISLKINGNGVNDEFRKSESFFSKLKQFILKHWFVNVENKLPLPTGLSLIAEATKK